MAETVRLGKPSGVSIRAFSHGEELALLEILRDAFRSFADVPRTKTALSSRRFDPDGCFVAEENGVPIGWLAVTSLPRDKWFVIRYLSVRRARLQTTVAESLLSKAITYAESKGPEFLRATTPAVQPYVEIYRKSGFKPLRRDFRINWQIEDIPQTRDPRLETEEVSEETIDRAGSISSGRRVLTGIGERKKKVVLWLSLTHSKKTGLGELGGSLLVWTMNP